MQGVIRQLGSYAKAAIGRALLPEPDVDCATERFGSDYGGWEIVPTNITSLSVVYSFGVGEDASFDVALIDEYDLTVHAFDPTPRSIEWVSRQGFSDRFVMHEYGIAAFDGAASFHPPENPEHVSHTLLDRPKTKARAISVPVRRLSTIMADLGHDRIDIIKLDIEGAEYDVVADISASHIRPRQVLVEFHHRLPGVGVKKTREAIARLRSMGYRLFSVADSGEEFCFIRGPC
jgi:FkbM family methyltransferase